MSEAHPLSTVFSAHLSSCALAELAGQDLPALEKLLEERWESGRAKWPDLAVAAPIFVQHLAERTLVAGSFEELSRSLQSLNAAELYLACGCVYGLDDSLHRFDQTLIGRVPAFLGHMRLPAALVADVQQEVRSKLLVSRDGKLPGIATYAGRGELSNFVRAVAVRTVISIRRKKDEQFERDDGSMAEQMAGTTADPVLESMKRQYSTEFKDALSQAIAMLSSEQRNLLRLFYVDGLPTTRIAALFALNQSNVSRRISAARSAIFDETKRQMCTRLKLTESSFEELSRLVQSQLDLSMSRLLK